MTTAFSPTGTAASLYPGIVTARFVATCEFYFEHFNFRPAIVEDDFMLLVGPRGARLGLLRAGDERQPAALQTATRGTGGWLHLEVDDPDAVHARLAAAGVEIVAEPQFTLSATRRFIVRDPAGMLVFVSDRTTTPPLPLAVAAHRQALPASALSPVSNDEL